MYELRCPSCRMRLWLYQGMDREVPLPHDCPACHVSRPIDRSDVAAARLAARIASDRRAARGEIAAPLRDRGAPLRPGSPR